MALFETLIDVAILGTQISQRNKLQQLQQQHANTAAIQAVVLVLRQEIFKFKQASEEILALETRNPKMAAGALEILYQRFQQAGLTPELFPDLSDKEYVAATTHHLRNQHGRLLTQLTPAEQLEVTKVADTVMRLPQYKEYLEQYDAVMNYRAALPIYERLKGRKTGFFTLNLFGTLIVLMLMVISMVASLLIPEGSAIANFSCWGAFLIVAACIFLTQKYTRPAEFKSVKEIVEATKANVDLEKFASLEQALGTDDGTVRRQQQAAQQLVNQFFADAHFSAMLSS